MAWTLGWTGLIVSLLADLERHAVATGQELRVDDIGPGRCGLAVSAFGGDLWAKARIRAARLESKGTCSACGAPLAAAGRGAVAGTCARHGADWPRPRAATLSAHEKLALCLALDAEPRWREVEAPFGVASLRTGLAIGRHEVALTIRADERGRYPVASVLAGSALNPAARLRLTSQIMSQAIKLLK